MITLRMLPLLIIGFSFTSTFGQSKKALKCYNKIIEIQYAVNPMIVTFLHMQSEVGMKKHDAWCEQERLKIENKVAHSIKHIQRLKNLEGIKELKLAAVEMLAFYQKSFNVEYKEMVALNSQAKKSPADEAMLKELRLRLISEEEELDHKLTKAQEDFALRHHLNFTDISTRFITDSGDSK